MEQQSLTKYSQMTPGFSEQNKKFKKQVKLVGTIFQNGSCFPFSIATVCLHEHNPDKCKGLGHVSVHKIRRYYCSSWARLK